jgi:hypothetical protein
MLRNNRYVGMISRAQLVNDSGDVLSGGFMRDSRAWSILEGRVDTLWLNIGGSRMLDALA